MKKHTLLLILSFLSGTACAQFNETNNNILPEEKAFIFQAQMIKPDLMEVQWGADEGYHLYHDKFKFEIVSKDVKLGTYKIPPGKKIYIPILNETLEEHTGVFKIDIPVQGHGNFTLKAYGQGCAGNTVCYPPFVREVKLKN